MASVDWLQPAWLPLKVELAASAQPSNSKITPKKGSTGKEDIVEASQLRNTQPCTSTIVATVGVAFFSGISIVGTHSPRTERSTRRDCTVTWRGAAGH
jgi:hypothetical protein